MEAGGAAGVPGATGTGCTILEIGVGTGQDSAYFQEEGFAVVDFHPVDTGRGHRFQSLTLRRPETG